MLLIVSSNQTIRLQKVFTLRHKVTYCLLLSLSSTQFTPPPPPHTHHPTPPDTYTQTLSYTPQHNNVTCFTYNFYLFILRVMISHFILHFCSFSFLSCSQKACADPENSARGSWHCCYPQTKSEWYSFVVVRAVRPSHPSRTISQDLLVRFDTFLV